MVNYAIMNGTVEAMAWARLAATLILPWCCMVIGVPFWRYSMKTKNAKIARIIFIVITIIILLSMVLGILGTMRW